MHICTIYTLSLLLHTCYYYQNFNLFEIITMLGESWYKSPLGVVANMDTLGCFLNKKIKSKCLYISYSLPDVQLVQIVGT